MKIQIICHDNNAGLSRDRQITHEILKQAGHEVDLTNNKVNEKNNKQYDINIFHEIIDRKYYHQAKKNIFFPNPEWYFDNLFRSHITGIDLVCAKTRDCEQIFKKKRIPTVFTSFTSYDKQDITIKRQKEFFHTCGKSINKGTEHIKNAWLKGDMPTLTLIEDAKFGSSKLKTTGLNHILSRISDIELKILQNKCLFHIYPSKYEGFGHAIWEAKSCGAIVLTINSPPMSEFVNNKTGVMIHPTRFKKRNLVVIKDTHHVYIKEAVDKALDLSDSEIKEKSKLVREDWERNDGFFRKSLIDLIKCL